MGSVRNSFLFSLPPSAQTLDSAELQGDGIVLSLEEQLNALSLSSNPSPSGSDSKDTVALNGTHFPSQLFEDTSESTKVGDSCAPQPHITITLDGICVGAKIMII